VKESRQSNEDGVIKTKHEIEKIRAEFERLYEKNYKIEAIWILGLQIGLRISQLLSIQYEDVDFDSQLLISIDVKTCRLNNLILNGKAIEVINRLRELNPNDEYLFQATGNRVAGIKPVSRQYVTKCFSQVASNLKINLSTHSMRKTRGYMLHKQTNNLAYVRKSLGHTSIAQTLRYIGIAQEDTDNGFDNLEL